MSAAALVEAQPIIQPRWRATVVYLSEAGSIDVEHHIEELVELQDLVERGPDWNAIDKIEIVLMRGTGRLTIEQAERS